MQKVQLVQTLWVMKECAGFSSGQIIIFMISIF